VRDIRGDSRMKRTRVDEFQRLKKRTLARSRARDVADEIPNVIKIST